jgi:YgiT-type zinc finger domain-containing protein
MQMCPYCHTGKMKQRKVVFVQWHDPNSIVVDWIPAMVCDTCGEKSYDSFALENLHRLLWPAANDRHASRPLRANNR